jgi:hypothetical protein
MRAKLGIQEGYKPRLPFIDLKTTAFMNTNKDIFYVEAFVSSKKYCALYATLTNPLGKAWSTVNGQKGVVMSKQFLKENAGLFASTPLKKHDNIPWFTFTMETALAHIRTKCYGTYNPIPDGTVIYAALLYPESPYLQHVLPNMIGGTFIAPNQALFARLNKHSYCVPSACAVNIHS